MKAPAGLLSGSSQEDPSSPPPSSGVASKPRCSLAGRRITPASASASLACRRLSASLLSHLTRTAVTGSGPPHPVWPHLNPSHRQRPCFQIRSPSQAPGVGASACLFGVHNSTHKGGLFPSFQACQAKVPAEPIQERRHNQQ